VAHWPQFDHAVGDPVFPQGVSGKAPEPPFLHADRPVIVEGNYLLLWPEVRALFDLTIFLDLDLEKAIARLKVRNRCIPGYTEEEIFKRCDLVDRTNAQKTLESRVHADVCVDARQGVDSSE